MIFIKAKDHFKDTKRVFTVISDVWVYMYFVFTCMLIVLCFITGRQRRIFTMTDPRSINKVKGKAVSKFPQKATPSK